MLIRSILLACVWVIATLVIPPARAVDVPDLIRGAIRLPCEAGAEASLKSLAARLPLARAKRAWVQYSPGGMIGRRLVFGIGADELTVQYSGPTGSPDHVAVRYLAGAARRPLLLAIADHTCTIHTARRETYDAAGRPEWLQDLDDELRPVGEREPLNPPVPPGDDPPGIPIGVVDSGVNYLLPEISSRLARDPEGKILGYDYWDLDPRPFDVSPTPDPFFPGHHGTRTSSLVLEGAPVAKLVPYRYPRHAMARMKALIEDAAARGVRVMNVALVSRDRDEWLPFRDAAGAHPEMLFVVAAGNYGRNIEEQPHYPAVFPLANMVVVTSATADGRLTPGVNWGPTSVDLMARGDRVGALDFDGQWRFVSGSSYATARVSALAACLLAGHPEWSTARLRAAILQKAEASEAGEVAAGFIPDAALDHRSACRPLQVSSRQRRTTR